MESNCISSVTASYGDIFIFLMSINSFLLMLLFGYFTCNFWCIMFDLCVLIRDGCICCVLKHGYVLSVWDNIVYLECFLYFERISFGVP